MFVQSVVPIWSRYWQNRIANALTVAPGIKTNLNVRLFTAYSVAPNPDSVAADFTEAAFNGYAVFDIFSGINGPVNLESGNGACTYGGAYFTAGTGLVPPGETILGYFVEDSATPPNLILAELFQTPIPIAHPFDNLDVEVIFPAPFAVATGL